MKSGADTFRRLILSICSRSAAITVSWYQPEQMPRVLEIAMQTALSRRGVAVVTLPGDVVLRDAVEQAPRVHFSQPKPTVCPSGDEINLLADILNRSKKITILAGAGCAGAHAELIDLAGKLKAPIVHAMRGKEIIEYDNPFDVGMTGLLGFSSGNHAMMNCDLLLMIGTDFPYQQFFPKDARIVQIDLRGEQIGRRSKVDFGFVGDTKTTLRALLPKLEQNQYEAHLTASLEHYREARQRTHRSCRCDWEDRRDHSDWSFDVGAPSLNQLFAK
jgi:pyruvate dehydrogenase (quinone)